jgi:hypothetical protein
MNWYFASRMRHADVLSNIKSYLKEAGHYMVFDWTLQKSLKPYNIHINEAGTIAKDIITALAKVEVFVLLCDEAGTDMFVELGAALAYYENNPKIRIYAVGKHNLRSLMHCHPAIKQVDTVQHVFVAESIEVTTELDNLLTNITL